MEITFLLKGLLIGLSVAAPVGPMAVLCIQRTLDRGRTYGLISGLGIATADATYGFIAGFGLTFISNALVSQQLWIRLVGGAFLIYLGLKTILTPAAKRAAPLKGGSAAGAYASTFLLTLTNPTTILSFVALFVSVGLVGASRSYLSAAILVLGVFAGSALWWLVLTGGVSLFRAKLTPQRLTWVNRISGGVIMLFGLLAIFSAIV